MEKEIVQIGINRFCQETPNQLFIRNRKKNKISLILPYDKENNHKIFSILKKKQYSQINIKPLAIKELLKTMKIDNNIHTQQIKCFMSFSQKHTSHIIDKKIVKRGLTKILGNDRIKQEYIFNYAPIQILTNNITTKTGDSQILLTSYQNIWNTHNQYPPTVQLMLCYLGVYIYSVNSQYQKAQAYCQKIFDLIVTYKTEQFFIVYLLLRIKLKTNLCEWEEALKYLTKLLVFSWMYAMVNLQIWCYFQFSRAYFFIQKDQQAKIFRKKSENNTIEPKKSIYREVCVAELVTEIFNIWEGKLDFTFVEIIQSSRLQMSTAEHYNIEEYISDQRKLKSSIKHISQQCRIRHVSNLLTRVSQIGFHQLSRGNSQKKITESPKSGNNFLLTHQSFNKNMNMFFRKRKNTGKCNPPVFYTIENSQKSWVSLKDMMRNILMQMNFYYAISDWQKDSVIKKII